VVGRTRSFFSALPVFDARVFEAGAGDAVGVAGGDKLATFTRCCADIFESNSNVGAYVKKKEFEFTYNKQRDRLERRLFRDCRRGRVPAKGRTKRKKKKKKQTSTNSQQCLLRRSTN
jgi:hypothetical protein